MTSHRTGASALADLPAITLDAFTRQTAPLPVGAVVDLVMRDQVSQRDEVLRIACTEAFDAPEDRRILRLRFRAIGGGPTNVPRWEAWPSLVYDASTVASMVRTGTMRLVS